MNEIRAWLQGYAPLSDSEWSALYDVLTPCRLEKNDRFQVANRSADTIGILLSGALYAKYAEHRRRHGVAYFNLPSVNRVVCDLQAFTQNSPAGLDIVATEPCSLMVMSREQLHELYDCYPGIERLGRRLAEYSYAMAMDRIGRMQLRHKDRIADLESRYPQVFEKFQAQQIADYLGINRHQYSKLRGQLRRAA